MQKINGWTKVNAYYIRNVKFLSFVLKLNSINIWELKLSMLGITVCEFENKKGSWIELITYEANTKISEMLAELLDESFSK